MLSTGVMVMTTMATACASSFLEVDEEEEEEEVAAEGEEVVEAAAVEAVDRWDRRAEGMAPPLDAQSTGFLCQVSDVLHCFS